ncbi:hypothetical protein J6590_082927 [Homalodisca vitripennis]|nr:hypothetical protein J6590_082927 [Homalodisca vitripennis]
MTFNRGKSCRHFNYSINGKQLERVFRMRRLLGTRLGYTFLDTPVAEVEDMFGLQSLSLRRKFLDLVFLNNIVSGVLDCPVILRYIDISIPRGTRSKTIFQRRSMPHTMRITRQSQDSSAVAVTWLH